MKKIQQQETSREHTDDNLGRNPNKQFALFKLLTKFVIFIYVRLYLALQERQR